MDNLTIPVLFPNDRDWQACFEAFMRDLYNRSCSLASTTSYAGILARFFKDKDPASVTRVDVSNFVYSATGKPWARGSAPATSTVNARVAAIRSFYNTASAWPIGLSSRFLFEAANPCSGFRFGKPLIAYRDIAPEDVAAFFNAIDLSVPTGKRDHALFSFFVQSARRRSEVLRLRFGDLTYGSIPDEAGGSHLGWTYSFTGKGKAGQQDREEISGSVVALIMEYLEEVLPTMPPAPTCPLWLSIGPGEGKGGNVKPGELRPLSGRAATSAMKKYARLGGLDPDQVSLHSWRHTSAKMRFLSGSSIPQVSLVLRHASWDMTRRYIGALCATSDPGGQALEQQLMRLGVLKGKSQ